MLRMKSGMWRLRAYSMMSSAMPPPMTRSMRSQCRRARCRARRSIGVQVAGAVERERAVGGRDRVVGAARQPRIELVGAQRLQHKQHVGDRHQRHGEQRRPAEPDPVVVEDVEEKGDRRRVVQAIQREGRARCRGVRSLAGYIAFAMLASHLLSHMPFDFLRYFASPGWKRQRGSTSIAVPASGTPPAARG